MSWRWTAVGMAATFATTMAFVLPDNYYTNAKSRRVRWLEGHRCNHKTSLFQSECMAQQKQVQDELEQIEEWKTKPL